MLSSKTLALLAAVALTSGIVSGTTEEPPSPFRLIAEHDGPETEPLLHRTFQVDLEALTRQAHDEGAIRLDLPTGALPLLLQVADLQAPGHTAYQTLADGTEVALSAGFLGTYTGFVPGFPDAGATVTLTPHYLNVVVTDEELGAFSVETTQAVQDPHRAAVDLDVLLAGTASTGVADLPDVPCASADELLACMDSYFPRVDLTTATGYFCTSEPDYLVNYLDLLSMQECIRHHVLEDAYGLRIVLVYLHSDGEFYTTYGSSGWMSAQAAILNNMRTIYENEANVRPLIWTQNTYTTANQPSSSTNACTLLSNLQSIWKTNSNSRDFMLFFSERNLSPNGCALAAGYSDPKGQGYSVIETLPRTATEEKRLAAHEVGHLFGGEHNFLQDTGVRINGNIQWTLMAAGTFQYRDDFSHYKSSDVRPHLEYNEYRIEYCANNQAECQDSLYSPGLL